MEKDKNKNLINFTLCGYSNCFRPFYKMRGFMPCCEFHYKYPKKWGKNGKTFTGSIFTIKRIVKNV
jgi:hypothetical protein